MRLFIFILGLLFISVAVAKKLWLLVSFAGSLPVVSCVLALKLLIINTIRFRRFVVFSALDYSDRGLLLFFLFQKEK